MLAKNQGELKLSIAILFEDSNVIVINKPAGLLMHPKNDQDQSSSVFSVFSSQLAPADNLRGGIVHRLDKDTSGVVIMAKNESTLEFLQQQFAARTVDKTYLALVWGHLSHPKARIELPVRRSLKSPNVMAVHPSGKMSISQYQVLAEYKDYSYLSIDIHTGRTHQIRIQFAHLGHSVVGDKLYGKKALPQGLARQFLHAEKLSILLPNKKVKKTFYAPLPADLSSFLGGLE